MWTGNTTRGKVIYIEEQLKKEHSELMGQNKQLLTKIDSLTKLVEQMLSILLSYNPKLAEQTKEELEKINDKTDDKGDESTGDSSRQ